MSRPLHSVVPSALLAVAVALGGCALPWNSHLEEDLYEDVSYEDVFEVAVAQIDRDYEIARADATRGVIESSWTPVSVASRTRQLQRQKVVAHVVPEDDGVRFEVRVRTQVRARGGILASELDEEGWKDAPDDERRAANVAQKVRSVLRKGRPSEEFYAKPTPFGPPDPTEEG